MQKDVWMKPTLKCIGNIAVCVNAERVFRASFCLVKIANFSHFSDRVPQAIDGFGGLSIYR